MNSNSLNVASSIPSTRAKSKSIECDPGIEMKEMQRVFTTESSGLSVHGFAQHVTPHLQQARNDLTTSNLSGSVSSKPTSPRSLDQHPKRLQKNQKSSDNSTNGKVIDPKQKLLATRVNIASMEILKANVEDDDLDLNSLRDLMISMRQTAKEIKEITNPSATKTEKKDQAVRSKEQKRHHKRKSGHRRRSNSGNHQQQIQAEIHVISECAAPQQHSLSPSPSETSSSSVPIHIWQEDLEEGASSSTPPSSPPTAYLHVENEELCNTWPKRRGRSVSRQRSMTDSANAPSKPGACSEGNSPMVLTPQCNLWLQHAPASGTSIRGQDRMALRQNIVWDFSGIKSSHGQVGLQANAVSVSQQKSRGRSPKRIPGRPYPVSPPQPPHSPLSCCTPSPPPLSTPSSPLPLPPDIIVSEHGFLLQEPHQGQGQHEEEGEITIDIPV